MERAPLPSFPAAHPAATERASVAYGRRRASEAPTRGRHDRLGAHEPRPVARDPKRPQPHL
eukprot:scaffold39869_cov32-Tisochrysis_lutea.AAC.3